MDSSLGTTTTLLHNMSWTYYANGMASEYDYALLGRDPSADYAYDAAGQLSEADYSAGYAGAGSSATPTSFSLDYNGNNASGTTLASGDNQITNDGTWTYAYDPNGNLQSKTDGSETVTYSYDFHNRLTKVAER